MPEVETFKAWAESMDSMSYYAILRVPEGVDVAAIKEAFHSFALDAHPDRYVDHEPEVAEAAAEVFRRGVEAYNVLSNRDLRARYDSALAAGHLRLDPALVPPAPTSAPLRTLEAITEEPRAKELCRKADHFIAIGKLDEARALLVTARQHDPHNQELEERLKLLWEAIALEPG
jgi:curved DNA-binding protein CbpA